MKTNELIAVLSTNIEPVDTRKLVRKVCAAILIGSSVALSVAIFALGIRADLRDPGALAFLFPKLVFALSVVSLASVYLFRHLRPGGEFRSGVALTALPFLALMILAGVNLTSAAPSHWEHMLLGGQWLECLISIPIIAVVPFAVIMWAVRFAAPTDLTRTGALAGLLAGGVSAIGYALHCTDDSLPFIALWYGATIVLCALTGAVLGRRLLRW